jgi:segregation and condensation protein B
MTARSNDQKIEPPSADLLPAVLESLLFVAGEPQEIGTLAKTVGLPRQRVEKAIDALIDQRDGRGVFVQRLGERVQLATVPDAAKYIERFMEVDYGRLSRAALETLAIIAYRQPITRGGIEAVRGVNSDYSVHTLLARGLIEEVGRAPGPGRPILLASTHRFLEYFGLQQPADLPPLPEMEGVDLDAHANTQPLPEPAEFEDETDDVDETEEELVETASG